MIMSSARPVRWSRPSAANGVQRCPHGRREIVVIAVVVPATAAHVRTREVTHMRPT
jgi:hypothetical protein